ncbi:MAG: glutathione peroxidase [Hydrogenophilaceae bacterium]|nr:glutathione peroxidase [Hydrogenophilaceae bacterium]
MKLFSFFLFSALLTLPLGAHAQDTCPTLLDHEFTRLSPGKSENLCQYRGKVILVVNTASRCGFTPQFEGLQKLYNRYRAKGFTVLGFPSNDFNQELAEGKDIASFCKLNYGVDFPMFEKSSVRGAKANSFHQALTRATGSEPSWNFHKYLIARDGKTVIPLESRIEPDSREVRTKIEAMLEQRG